MGTEAPGREPLLVLAVNPGSTSTKIALFAGDPPELRFQETLRHGDDELAPFAARPLLDQLPLRTAAVRAALERHGVAPPALAAVAGRGGLLRPLPGGTYRVTPAMLEELGRAERGDHASNLGAPLARALADAGGCEAYIVDPVSVDEWEPVARLSGLAGLDRESLSHALNGRAVARRFAREAGRAYRDLRLVVAHLGSGISVSAHRDGRMVDATNSREEGAFSTERAGGLPVMKLVELCFSGTVDRDTLERRIFREGGLYSYMGTRELPEVLRRAAAGGRRAALVIEALCYQVAREIGGMAAVLEGRVDAVLLTGGMAHAPEVVTELRRRTGWIAPVRVYPGEGELLALAEGALRVVQGEEPARDYPPAVRAGDAP
jgi:butyrate kinase